MISVLGNGGVPDYGDSGCKMYATGGCSSNPQENAGAHLRR